MLSQKSQKSVHFACHAAKICTEYLYLGGNDFKALVSQFRYALGRGCSGHC